jgi:hypothetical protein
MEDRVMYNTLKSVPGEKIISSEYTFISLSSNFSAQRQSIFYSEIDE